MINHEAFKTVRFNVLLLSLALMPVVFALESLVRRALLRESASVFQVLDGVAFSWMVLVLPYAGMALAHSGLMYCLRHRAHRYPRLFVAFTLLVVVAVLFIGEFVLFGSFLTPGSGRYDVAQLLTFVAYGAFARVP